MKRLQFLSCSVRRARCIVTLAATSLVLPGYVCGAADAHFVAACEEFAPGGDVDATVDNGRPGVQAPRAAADDGSASAMERAFQPPANTLRTAVPSTSDRGTAFKPDDSANGCAGEAVATRTESALEEVAPAPPLGLTDVPPATSAGLSPGAQSVANSSPQNAPSFGPRTPSSVISARKDATKVSPSVFIVGEKRSKKSRKALFQTLPRSRFHPSLFRRNQTVEELLGKLREQFEELEEEMKTFEMQSAETGHATALSEMMVVAQIRPSAQGTRLEADAATPAVFALQPTSPSRPPTVPPRSLMTAAATYEILEATTLLTAPPVPRRPRVQHSPVWAARCTKAFLEVCALASDRLENAYLQKPTVSAAGLLPLALLRAQIKQLRGAQGEGSGGPASFGGSVADVARALAAADAVCGDGQVDTAAGFAVHLATFQGLLGLPTENPAVKAGVEAFPAGQGSHKTPEIAWPAELEGRKPEGAAAGTAIPFAHRVMLAVWRITTKKEGMLFFFPEALPLYRHCFAFSLESPTGERAAVSADAVVRVRGDFTISPRAFPDMASLLWTPSSPTAMLPRADAADAASPGSKAQAKADPEPGIPAAAAAAAPAPSPPPWEVRARFGGAALCGGRPAYVILDVAKKDKELMTARVYAALGVSVTPAGGCEKTLAV